MAGCTIGNDVDLGAYLEPRTATLSKGPDVIRINAEFIALVEARLPREGEPLRVGPCEYFPNSQCGLSHPACLLRSEAGGADELVFGPN